MAILSISLSDEIVESQANNGQYLDVSDYMRDLVRRNQKDSDYIRLALIEGEQSGRSNARVEDIVEKCKKRLKEN